MKCSIISSEWKQSENGNHYCKLSCKPENDPWASEFTYVFFVRTEAEKDRLALAMPKFIYLAEVVIPMPAFNRAWREDGNNHVAGEIVMRKNRSGEMEAAVFTEVKVIVRTMADGTPAKGEDADKLAQQAYDRGILDGTIIPLDESGASDDMFDNIESTVEEPTPVVTQQPVQHAQQRPIQQIHR